jgi:hypothetical protein
LAVPSAVTVLLLALCLTVLIPSTRSVLAVENDGAPASGRIAFNIPAQPLSAALEIYARVSRREVLYDSALAEGRRSSQVEGHYTPEDGLQILLAGTGLWADFKDADFFVVGLASPGDDAHAPTANRSVEQGRYYGRLQSSLKAAFCGSNALPDGDRVAARLWIGQWGQVLQVKRLTSTGSGVRDQQVEALLRGLRLGASPPEDFAQPITIVIMPDAPDARHDCDDARSLPVRAGP